MTLARVAWCGHSVTLGASCPRCGPSPAERAESLRKRKTQNYVEVYGTKRWKELRLMILRRDRFICQECGGKATAAAHLVPYTGADDPRAWDPANLAASCVPCNSREASQRWHDRDKEVASSRASASSPKPRPIVWVS